MRIIRDLCSFLIAAAVLIAACNNNKKTTNERTKAENPREITTGTDANTGLNNLTDLQKVTEDLQKLPPLSPDQLKTMIPEELMDGKRLSCNATTDMGTGTVNAEYKINDSTDIKLIVYDCGGPGGAGIYSMQYLGRFNMESGNDYEYTKTIDFNRRKAIEKCQKDHNDCSLTYFTGTRFLIELEGDNVGIDRLKQAANSLAIK